MIGFVTIAFLMFAVNLAKDTYIDIVNIKEDTHVWGMYETWFGAVIKGDDPIKKITFSIDKYTKDYRYNISNDSFISFMDYCMDNPERFTHQEYVDFMKEWSQKKSL